MADNNVKTHFCHTCITKHKKEKLQSQKAGFCFDYITNSSVIMK